MHEVIEVLHSLQRILITNYAAETFGGKYDAKPFYYIEDGMYLGVFTVRGFEYYIGIVKGKPQTVRVLNWN